MKLCRRIVRKSIRELIKQQVLYRRNKYLSKYKNSKKIIILLFPDDDSVNGGILSLASIYNELVSFKYLHHCDVIAATYPYYSNSVFLEFSKFKNNVLVFDFKKVLRKIKEIKELHIHIPELYVKQFVESFEKEWTSNDKNKLLIIDKLHINILNQNDMLMPEFKFIEKIKELVTKDITMTMAHKKYATIDKRNEYNVPLHYLSARTNQTSYKVNNYINKENIILFSPDELSRLNIDYHLTKNDLISKLETALPKYKIIVIENLTYEEYKDLVARSMFMITFGEGLDNYLIETILSGGISFAIYNEKFFTKDYLDIPTLYSSVDELFNNLIFDIKKLDNREIFDEYNAISREVVEREYSYRKYRNRVENYLLGNYDFK